VQSFLHIEVCCIINFEVYNEFNNKEVIHS